MAISRKEEARALSINESELVERSHHPALQELADDDLFNLVKQIRGLREKAKTQADQRTREIRGKAPVKGVRPSQSDEGSKIKVAVLAMAVRRLNNEVERRRKMAAATSLVESAQNALLMKQAQLANGPAHNSRHAHTGMRNAVSQRRQKLVRPMELGRQRKAASVAQAKRDGR